MKKIWKIGLISILGLVLTLCGYVMLSLPASLPLSPPEDDMFRVRIANINHTNSDADALAETLLKTGSDVMLVFEWTGSNLNLSALKKQGFTLLLNEPCQGTHGVCACEIPWNT